MKVAQLNVQVVLMDIILFQETVPAPKDVLISVRLVKVQLFVPFVSLVTQQIVRENVSHAYQIAENAQEVSKHFVLNVEVDFT